MDVDAYVAAHRADWERLAVLLRRRRWDGAEADEVVELYQRTATHLSVVRSASPDPALVGRLSSLVARARATVTGTASPAWRDAARFVTLGFAVAVATSWRWWVPTWVLSIVGMVVAGAWVAANPDVQASVASPAQTRRLVEQDFAAYYSSNPATSFAAQVWTNNALIAVTCLVTGVLIVPVLWVLLQNVLNVGVTGGILAANGRLDLFLGLITPHGLLELTAVFIAAGAGLKLGWTWIDPGPRTRGDALAHQGRITAGMALGVAAMLAVAGVIEAFVTPSGLPTWARIGIGVLAELVFVAYVLLGAWTVRRAGSGDVAGVADVADVADVDTEGRGASAPVVG